MKRPNASSFLAGFIENNIDEWFSGIGIDLAKDLGRDLDQVAVEIAFVPFGESLGKLRRVHFGDVVKNCVGFTDQLHVSVFDAVVHHFDVVTGAVRSHVSTTGLAINLGRDFAENWRDHFP